MRALFFFSLIVLLLAPSCDGGKREESLIFVAASLTDVMDHLGDRFDEEEGIRVRFNVGGSRALAQQIIRGAPADAFISAGPLPMDLLEQRGLLIKDTRVDLLTNELVLVGSPTVAAKQGISSVEDIGTTSGRVVMADPDLAPAGRYAKEALMSLGLWDAIKSRLVFGPDVRVALAYLETGNVEAGIVYLTDITLADGLEVLATVPRESHSPIIYPAAVVKGSSHGDAAREFLEFISREEARETFRQHGFVPLER